MATKIIYVNINNVSREEQQELRRYLEENCWEWKEVTSEDNIFLHN